jgi:bifunctional ADP-heptose synthase (sugar kinase/adenylyltransferase)
MGTSGSFTLMPDETPLDSRAIMSKPPTATITRVMGINQNLLRIHKKEQSSARKSILSP